MKIKLTHNIVIFVLLVILTACGPSHDRLDTALTEVTPNSITSRMVLETASTIAPTFNPTPTASQTIIPSSTPSYTPSPTSTPSYTPTITPPIIRVENATKLTLLDTLPGFHEAVGIKFTPDELISIQPMDDGALQQSPISMNISLDRYISSTWYFASPSFSTDGSMYFSQAINKSGYALSVFNVDENLGLKPLGENILGYSLKGFYARFSNDNVYLASIMLPQLIEPTPPPNVKECAPHCFLTFSYKSMTSGIFNLAGMKRITTLDITTNNIEYSRLEFSPDDQYLATINFGPWESDRLSTYVRLWQISDGKLFRQFETYPLTHIKDEKPNLIFSPDGLNLAFIAGGKYQVWRWQTNTLLWNVKGIYTGLDYSPEGSLLVTGSSDGSIQLWEAVSGRLLQTLDGHKYPILAVAFSPNGSLLVSLDENGVLKLWGIPSGGS